MHYSYICFSCKKEFPAAGIEDGTLYLCPDCGTAEKNRPLTGVLSVKYDYPAIAKKLTREKFLKLPVGQPWQYPELWPLEYRHKGKSIFFPGIPAAMLALLSLPANLYQEFELDKQQIGVLDDTRNPTFSFKDRASILVAMKALQKGFSTLSVASTGNAGSSLAGVAARLGLTAHVWVPENLPDNKRIQVQAYGAHLHLVKGDYDTAFDLNLDISRELNWYNRNTAFNPLTVEGKKSAGYDLFLSLKGKMPDHLFVPAGDGVVLSGIYKGLQELHQLGWLEHMPRIIAVQAAGSNALYRFVFTGKFEFRPAHTLADSICAGAPRNLFMAADVIEKTHGEVVTVTDTEIVEAQQVASRQWGMLVEPAAAASLAGYRKMKGREDFPRKSRAVLFFTGNGLKDSQSLQQWNPRPPSHSVEEWKDLYHIR